MAATETDSHAHTAAMLAITLNLELVRKLAEKQIIDEAAALDLYRKAVDGVPALHQGAARDIINGLVGNGVF